MNYIILLLLSIILINIGFSITKLCDTNDIIYIFLVIGMLSLIYLILNKKNIVKIDKKIILASLFLLIGYSIFMYVIQKNEISRMTCYGNIFGILLITLIGIFYFQEKLSSFNILGILLMCVGIYLLSLKK